MLAQRIEVSDREVRIMGSKNILLRVLAASNSAETAANGVRIYVPGWRAGWDSNPRRACTLAGFQDRCIQPLCHLPGGILAETLRLIEKSARCVQSFCTFAMSVAVEPISHARLGRAERSVLPSAAPCLRCVMRLARHIGRIRRGTRYRGSGASPAIHPVAVSSGPSGPHP